jgi:hypothetical protein
MSSPTAKASIINAEQVKYNSFSTKQLPLNKDLSITHYESEIKKTQQPNSYSMKKVYDLSSCKALSYYKSRVLTELRFLEPEYESFIKIKNTIYNQHETELFNQVRFDIQKDKSHSRFWITMTLSCNKDLTKNEEFPVEPEQEDVQKLLDLLSSNEEFE